MRGISYFGLALLLAGCAASTTPTDTSSEDETGEVTHAAPLPNESADAGPWVYSNDFTLASNPGGVWSVGTNDHIGGTFTPFDLSRGVFKTKATCGVIEIWSSENGAQVWKNVGGRTCFGVANGQISMHPSIDGTSASIRFVAPRSGSYAIHIQYLSGDTGQTHGYAHLGADVLVDAITDSSPSFEGTRTLTAGQVLEVELEPVAGATAVDTPVTITLKLE